MISYFNTQCVCVCMCMNMYCFISFKSTTADSVAFFVFAFSTWMKTRKTMFLYRFLTDALSFSLFPPEQLQGDAFIFFLIFYICFYSRDTSMHVVEHKKKYVILFLKCVPQGCVHPRRWATPGAKTAFLFYRIF